MLTDLYLTGYVADEEGKVHRTNSASHPDPVLDEALGGAAGRSWTQLITNGGGHAREVVRDQLEAIGWVNGRERRTFGVLPHARQAVYDVDMVGSLAERVTQALRNILDDRPADPRPLALGLIAVLAQMPVVSNFNENELNRMALREMTFAAIEPILALHHAIHSQSADMGSGWGGSGGCGGGGCGGGGCGGGGS